jgi:hypothetical protein
VAKFFFFPLKTRLFSNSFTKMNADTDGSLLVARRNFENRLVLRRNYDRPSQLILANTHVSTAYYLTLCVSPPTVIAYLLTYLHTYSLTYLLPYLLTYLPPYLLTYLLTPLFIYLLTYSLISLLTYFLNYLLTPIFTYLLTYSLIYLLPYLFPYSLN